MRRCLRCQDRRTRDAVRYVIKRTGHMIDAVLASARRSALKTAKLRDEALVIQQFDATAVQQRQQMHTPGHTPEHISLVVTDHTRSEEPWFVLTGHTLMVGDLGRTELATSAEEGARNLFASVQRLKALPDHLEVLPGAYSGSVCGRSLSGKPTSTIGFEKRYNKAFRIEDEPTFLRTMLADIPPAPPQASQVRALNSGLMAGE